LNEKINKDNYESFFLDYIEKNLSPEQRKMVEEFIEKFPDLRAELEDYEPLGLEKPDHEPKMSWEALKRDEKFNSDTSTKDELFFKAVEEDLTNQEKKVFEKYISTEQGQKEYRLWEKTKLNASPVYFDKSKLYEFGLGEKLAAWNYDYYLSAFAENELNEGQIAELQAYASKIPSGERDLKLAGSLRLKAPQGIFYPDKDELRKEKKSGGVIWLYRISAVAAAILLGVILWNLPTEDTSDELPVADKKERIDKESSDSDSMKTAPAIQSGMDSLKLKKEAENQEPLLEWEVREPDSYEVAEKSAPRLVNPKRESALDTVQPKPVGSELTPEATENFIAYRDSLKTGITPDTIGIDLNENHNTLAQEKSPKEMRKIEYQTLDEVAAQAVANRLSMSDEERDQIALSLAKRFTNKASELLDAEVTKEEFEETQHLTYTLRVGSFKVKHSRKK
jgi:hypothetical protein